MTPTKEQLEALAEKHCSHPHDDDWEVAFTLDQLDAYFLERLKMEAGEPVISAEDCRLVTLGEVDSPLFALEMLK